MLRFTIRDLLWFTVVVGLIVGWWADRRSPNVPTAEKIRADALAEAKAVGKGVMLVFAMRDQSWCDLLDKYHSHPNVSRVIGTHLVLARVDIAETPGGEQMYLEHGGMRGAPAFSILDSKGMLLADSGDVGQNVGFPNDAEQVDRYLAALKSACPKLSDEEVAVLREKLEGMRVTE